jgi:hypothetical protein
MCYNNSGAAVAATTNDIYQLVRNDSEEKIKTFATVDNVHVENSYKIVTPWMRYGYSFYLNHINSDTRDVIKGSTLGVRLNGKHIIYRPYLELEENLENILMLVQQYLVT